MVLTGFRRFRTPRISPARPSHTSLHSYKRSNPVRGRVKRCRWLLHRCRIRTLRILPPIFRQSRLRSSRSLADSAFRYTTSRWIGLRPFHACPGRRNSLVPRDDLVLALMDIRRVQQIAAAPPHQEFRPPYADRVVTPPPWRGLARRVFRQLRKREDVAPHLPGRRYFVAVGTHAQGNVQ